MFANDDDRCAVNSLMNLCPVSGHPPLSVTCPHLGHPCLDRVRVIGFRISAIGLGLVLKVRVRVRIGL